MPFKLNFLSIVNLYGCVYVHVCVYRFLCLSALYFPIRLALLLSFCADLLPNYFSFLFFLFLFYAQPRRRCCCLPACNSFSLELRQRHGGQRRIALALPDHSRVVSLLLFALLLRFVKLFLLQLNVRLLVRLTAKTN